MPTILIVDDEAAILESFQLALETDGRRVLLAANGREALRLALLHYPDVIVTDWDMPGMDGVQLTEQFRHHAALAATPVVMVSARPSAAQHRHLWNGFLRKPVKLAALETVIGALLAYRESRWSDAAVASRRPAINAKCWP